MRILFFLIWIAALGAVEPEAIYLVLPTHPESEIHINWLMPGSSDKQELKYRRIDTGEWFSVEALPKPLPKASPHTLFSVELTGLMPESAYEFVLADEPHRYFFRTQAAFLNHALRFVAGGDIFHDSIETVAAMNRVAAQQNPDFVLLGGDLAYASPKLFLLDEKGEYWVQFLKTWSHTMVRSDGTLIPMILTLGNHDVSGRFDQTPEKALFYYFLFSMPGYRVIDFGSFMSIIVLDTGHTHPVEGAQTQWLEEALKMRTEIPYKFALYHVPAYPCVRPFSNERSLSVRNCWVPLFEKFGLEAAFENHDHAYKRSHLLLNGKVDPQGVLYLGDGAWGVESPRKPHTPAQLWYLASSSAIRHVLLITLEGSKRTYEALNSKGVIFDSYTR